MLESNSLGTGTSVAITGTWQAAPPQKEQTYELLANAVKVIGTADAEVGNTHCLNLQYLCCGFLSSRQDRGADEFNLAEIPHSKEIPQRCISPNHPTSQAANSHQRTARAIEV